MIARLIISPDIQTRVEEIKKILTTSQISLNHPDLLYLPSGEKLGVEQTKKIREHLSVKPYSAKGRVMVVEDASVMTVEAQNSLLKTIEELPENALMILGAKSESDLLPTVVSRCQIVILKGAQRPIESDEKDAIASLQHDMDTLQTSTISERFEYIEKLKDKEEFLHALVVYFREILHKTGSPRFGEAGLGSTKEFLKELLQAEQWAGQNVNIRAILEYLMLVMPLSTVIE